MTALITKTVAKPFLYSCRQMSIYTRWSHTSIISTQVVGTLLRENFQKIYYNAPVMYSQQTNIPLPGNVADINAIETARFSPQRNRDISSDMITAQSAQADQTVMSTGIDSGQQPLDSYDCTGTVSLNSAMQTNVPEPFTTKKKAPVHLNMPGGEWSRSDKYIAEDMQNALHISKPDNQGSNKNAVKGIYTLKIMQAHCHDKGVHWWSGFQRQQFSSSSDQSGKKDDGPPPGLNNRHAKLSLLEKLQVAVKQYGSTVIVFHTSISLLSLGLCYLAVSSGIDLKELCGYLPVEIPEEVGGFVIAYAVHKAMAPLRVGTTLICAPVIVQFLRKKGYIKPPRTLKYYDKPKVPKKN